MESKTVTVPDIGCNGCVRTIESELREMAGVSQVKATLEDKQVTVTWDAPTTWEAIKARLVEIEYPPSE